MELTKDERDALVTTLDIVKKYKKDLSEFEYKELFYVDVTWKTVMNILWGK